jgi:hypothetical protein
VGRRPLLRPRHRWEDIIKMYFGGLNWIDLAQDKSFNVTAYFRMSLTLS